MLAVRQCIMAFVGTAGEAPHNLSRSVRRTPGEATKHVQCMAMLLERVVAAYGC